MSAFLAEIFHPIQFIGYAGMICAFVSYQCKKNATYNILQACCATFFAVQFLLLGGWSGFMLNIIAIARGLLFGFGGDKLHKWFVLVAIELAFIASFILAFTVLGEPWWIALIMFIAQAGGTLAMWTRKGKIIRIAQISFISPIWLYHNVFYAFSVGGILCETFNIISVIIAMIRFRKTEKEKQ